MEENKQILLDSNDNDMSSSTNKEEHDINLFIKDNYTNLLSAFQCPLTMLIFHDPVVADDGNIYEKDAIETHCNNGSKFSPMNRQPISSNFREVPQFNELIKVFIKHAEKIDPELKDSINTPSYEFSDNLESIYNCLKVINSDTTKLLKYKNYSLIERYHNKLFIKELLTKCTNYDVIKYIFENCTDLDFTLDNQMTLVHYVCMYSVPSVVKYIVDNKYQFNLDRENGNSERPFTLLIDNNRCRNYDIQLLFLNNIIDTEYTTVDGKTVFDLICINGDDKLIKHYILNKNVDLCKLNNGKLPIVNVIERQTNVPLILFMLKTMKDMDPTNIELADENGWRISHHICNNFSGDFGNNLILEYVLNNMDLEALTNDKHTPISIIFSKGKGSSIRLCMEKCKNINKYLLEQFGTEKKLLIHYLLSECRVYDIDLIIIVLDTMKELDANLLEMATSDGWRVSHYICRYYASDYLLIKYVGDNLKLDSVTTDGWQPFHFVCCYGSYDTISYFMGTGANIQSTINKYDGEDHEYLPINLIELNQNIRNNKKEDLINEILQYMHVLQL